MTADELTREQLQLYAKELQDLFRRERALRAQLEERNTALEQRVAELTALNKLFREHLTRYFAVLDAYWQLKRGLDGLAQRANALSAQAPSLPMPGVDEGVAAAVPASAAPAAFAR